MRLCGWVRVYGGDGYGRGASWVAHAPGANVRATVSKAAVAGHRNVLRSLCFTLAVGTAYGERIG